MENIYSAIMTNIVAGNAVIGIKTDKVTTTMTYGENKYRQKHGTLRYTLIKTLHFLVARIENNDKLKQNACIVASGCICILLHYNILSNYQRMPDTFLPEIKSPNLNLELSFDF